MRTLSLLATLALIGCDSGSVKLDDTGDDTALTGDDSAADDSAADDSAADDSAADDSATDDSADDTADDREGDTLTFDISGEWAGTTLSLTWIYPDDSAETGDVLASVEVSGASQDIEAPPPPRDDLVVLDPATFPDTYIAYYVPSLHVDSDGDGELSGDEAAVGAGLWWALWMEGDVPQALLQLGLRPGWNAIRVDFEDGGVPDVGPLDAIPLEAALWPTFELSLAGVYSAEAPAESLGLALVPGTLFEGNLPSSLMQDGPMEETWTLTLSGAPPDDHFEGDPSASSAFELPLAYVDADGSGSFSDGDTPYTTACLDARVAAALWTPQPTELLTAVIYTYYGYTVGWAPIASDDSGQGEDFAFISAEEAASLDISGGCSLE